MSNTDQDVTATYPDMAAARRAIQSLERSGVDGHDITLLGDADTAALRRDNIERDERVITYVARSAGIGAVIGVLIGGLIGVAVGVAIFPWLSGAMWGTAAGGAILGAALGVLLGGIVRLPQSNAGLATIDTPHKGEVKLGIHNTTGEDLDAAIEGTNPAKVEHVPDVRTELAQTRREAARNAEDHPAPDAEDPRPATADAAAEASASTRGRGRTVGAFARRRGSMPAPEQPVRRIKIVATAAAGLAVVGAIIVWVRRR